MLSNIRTRATAAALPGFVDSVLASGADAEKAQSGWVSIPALPAALADAVVYEKTPRPSFSRAARSMAIISDQEAAQLDAVKLERADTPAEYAVRLGLVTAEEVGAINESRQMRVSVDQRHRGSAAFTTWLADLKRADIHASISAVSAQDLAELQRARHAANGGGNEDAGLDVLQSARALFENVSAMGASDLHIMRKADHTAVQIRIKGDLRDVPSLTMRAEEGDELIRSIISGLTTTKEAQINRRQFQHAQINGYEVLQGTGLSSVRIVRGPSYPVSGGGQFLIARLQYGADTANTVGRPLTVSKPKPPAGGADLQRFNFSPRQLVLIDELMRLPHGVCLVTGPTGSGKTTLLNQLMKQQACYYPEARQVTAEEPIEYPMEWAIQVEATGDTWQTVIREFLRMDPDIGLLGELRSATEAQAAIQFAMTGHFVWSTLHTNDPFEVFTRLEDMDIERLALRRTCDAGKIVGAIAVRLVKVLCPHCSKPLSACSAEQMPPFILDALKTWAGPEGLSKVRLTGEGCAKCDGGSIGRRTVAEVVVTNPTLMEMMKRQGTDTMRKWHRQQPGSDKSMLENAMPLILSGVVSPMDVQREVSRIVPKEKA